MAKLFKTWKQENVELYQRFRDERKQGVKYCQEAAKEAVDSFIPLLSDSKRYTTSIDSFDRIVRKFSIDRKMGSLGHCDNDVQIKLEEEKLRGYLERIGFKNVEVVIKPMSPSYTNVTISTYV